VIAAAAPQTAGELGEAARRITTMPTAAAPISPELLGENAADSSLPDVVLAEAFAASAARVGFAEGLWDGCPTNRQ
jgi:hypothetical protein